MRNNEVIVWTESTDTDPDVDRTVPEQLHCILCTICGALVEVHYEVKHLALHEQRGEVGDGE